MNILQLASIHLYCETTKPQILYIHGNIYIFLHMFYGLFIGETFASVNFSVQLSECFIDSV